MDFFGSSRGDLNHGFNSGTLLMSVLDQYVYFVCSFFWSIQTTPATDIQKVYCEDIVVMSLQSGEDPPLMLSIAWNESRFLPNRKSTAGAVGPMQIMPKYWCPRGKRKGCDLVEAGFNAWQTYFLMEKGNEREALCRYSSGRRCKQSSSARRYAKKVLRTRDSMIRSLYSNWHERYVDEQCARCPDCCVQVTENGFIDEYGVERPEDWLPDD